MGLKEASTGLATRLKQIHELRVYPTDELPDSVNQFPAAIIVPGETEYVTTFSSTDADYNFRIILLFSKQDNPAAISKMLPYIAVSGDKSIVEVIHADATLDDNVETSRVVRNLGIGSIVWGGTPYISTEFLVQVWDNN